MLTILFTLLYVVDPAICVYHNEGNFYKELPPIFHIDNYEKCKNEEKLFCRINIKLNPVNQNVSYYWKLIEHSIEDSEAYNHNELFHAICVQDSCPNYKYKENTDLINSVIQCYERKLEKYNFSVNITNLKCGIFDDIHKPRALDITWMLVIIIFMLLTFWSTYIDSKFFKNGLISENKFITSFSLIKNFKKITNPSKNPEFEKLKCIQGIRFYNMLLVIFCHTFSSYIGGYVKNTEYFEEISQSTFKLGLRTLLVFLVQTFFLFSAFLMSYHFFQVMEKKKLNLKILWLAFFNRYLRIVPPVVVMLLMGCTIWVVRFLKGPIKDLYSDLEYQRCKKNWWTSLLFINNHYNQHDICYFTTWYLAADTQLYIISLAILALIWINKKYTKCYLTFFLLLGTIIPMMISYRYNLDVIYRITPENSKNNQFRSFKFNAIYSSTYSNMATYIIGLYFGFIYFNLQKVQICFSKGIIRLWYLLFIGLPVLVVTISGYSYSRFFNAILGGILKPLFAMGIAVGVFGMSNGLGGFIKKVCEWKPALILGNLTYSTYMVHYIIVFYRTATTTQPLYISDMIMMKSFLLDAVFSFFCGFLMHIFVEIPISNLQNIIVPQVRCHRTNNDTIKVE